MLGLARNRCEGARVAARRAYDGPGAGGGVCAGKLGDTEKEHKKEDLGRNPNRHDSVGTHRKRLIETARLHCISIKNRQDGAKKRRG